MSAYLGLFLIAFSGLALEVALVRLLSVTTWYHLAFFAISTAMLGMTAGAVGVYLRPKDFGPDKLSATAAKACIRFAVSLPAALVLLCLIPVGMYKSVMSLFALLLTTLACALPYYFAGVAVTGVLTKSRLPIGRLYASDLIGASLGCLAVLGGLELLDAPSLILLCGCAGALAGACFAWKEISPNLRRLCLWLAFGLLLAGLANSLSSVGIRPIVVKGKRIEPPANYYLERWNSFSRIAVYPPSLRSPHYWGPSPIAPRIPLIQYGMNIDGEAGTTVSRFDSIPDLEYLRYDVTNIAYSLGRRGDACVIGVGGGRDIQSAYLFGHKRITGVELNPIFVGLLRKDFRAFAGLADRPEVSLVTGEARSYLSRSRDKYAVLEMSLIDTWAATGAGAFSLSENALYTVEAWELFLNRLADDGVFTVSRWHSPERIGETGRVLSLAVAALLRTHADRPSDHIAMITSENVATLILSRQPFQPGDVAKLEGTADSLRFQVICAPGRLPADPLLRRIVSSRTRDELSQAIAGADLNYDPPTDESPYFFNMLRLRHLGEAFSLDEGIVHGNLIATVTLLALLIVLLVVALGAIVLPLAFRRRLGLGSAASAPILWPGAFYFALIGSGFMLTEIALIQRLTVLLSHPVYALGVLLFTLIASAGIGSLLSDRLPLARAPWVFVYPLLTAAGLVGLSFLLNVLLARMITASIPTRIAVSVAVIFPVGSLLGLFFPAGMRLAERAAAAETPWYWALNGIFGVLCSAIAVLISIYAGISTNFYLAAGCYLLVMVAQAKMLRASPKTPS